MPNKTISLPGDVLPIIESLEVPFSHWVAERLREHAASGELSFAEQLLADADLAGENEELDRNAIGERMGRSASW